MKTILHLPTGDFAFIEQEIEGTPQDAVEAFKALKEAYTNATHSGEGMTEKELDVWVENMFLGKGNNAEIYSKSTLSQQKELHRIKRALTRIKSRQQ